MSGELAAFGEQLRNGAQSAVDDINASGGINGKKVHLSVGDDQCDPPKARRVAADLVDDGISFVVGHFCSGSSIPASKIYGAERILQITPSSTNPALTEQAAEDGMTTVMRTAGRDDRQGEAVAQWLMRRYSGQPVAVIDDDSSYGREITAVVMQRLAGQNISVAVHSSFSPRQKDFTALVADLKAKNVKAVFAGGYHDELAPLVKAMRSAGLQAELAGPDALNTSEFWSLSGSAGEGVRYTDGAPMTGLPSAQNVVAAFRGRGFEPEGYTLTTYAAVQAFAAAAKATKSVDGVQLAAWLRANTVPSVIGDLRWDAKGDLSEVNYAWYVWHDGRAFLESAN